MDYIVHHMKANGVQKPKVFKIASKRLAPGESLRLDRSHSFKLITTRIYHPGEHAIELQVNGQQYGRTTFVLAHPEPA